MAKEVCTIPAHPGQLVSEVHVPRFLELLHLVLGGDLAKHLEQFVVLDLMILDGLDVTVDTEAGRPSRHDVEVGRPL